MARLTRSALADGPSASLKIPSLKGSIGEAGILDNMRAASLGIPSVSIKRFDKSAMDLVDLRDRVIGKPRGLIYRLTDTEKNG